MLEIKDHVAVITGGGSGIGEALAKEWVKLGGKVFIGDVAAEALKRVESDIKGMGGQVGSMVCDVTNEESMAEFAKKAMETFGDINLVVPCAGIIADGLFLSPDKETGKVKRKMGLDQFEKVININLTGVFLTTRECCEQMINNGSKGLVCLISSTSSLGTAGQINYCSTKAAMSVMPSVMVAEFFRKGLGDKIRCAAIAPGYVGTEMVKGMNQKALEGILVNVPIGRLVEPEEVASLIFEMYRNEAVNGAVYFLHGGLRLGSKG